MGHQNILKYDNRPFETLEEMNLTIIKNWNNAVHSKDCVYILGDLAWKNSLAIEVLKQLKGRKFLIKGNHDKPSEELCKYFEWVKDYAKIVDQSGHNPAEKIVLSHYPMISWDKSHHGVVHLYGHVHNGGGYINVLKTNSLLRESGSKQECYNVGCMLPYMDYTPRTLAQIRETAPKVEQQFFRSPVENEREEYRL